MVATGFGIGRLPGMPGTWAALAALPCAWAIRGWLGICGLAIAIVAAFAAGWWASARVVRESQASDPGYIVIDEIAAQWLVLAALPSRFWLYVAAFIAFRLFDIWKPWPISWLDRNVKGGLGIMLDDVMAAIYALALILIGEGALGVRP
jgi:phosphatidylglycerophosphatase A